MKIKMRKDWETMAVKMKHAKRLDRSKIEMNFVSKNLLLPSSPSSSSLFDLDQYRSSLSSLWLYAIITNLFLINISIIIVSASSSNNHHNQIQSSYIVSVEPKPSSSLNHHDQSSSIGQILSKKSSDNDYWPQTDHHHHGIIGSIKKLNNIRRQQLSTTITPFIDQDDDSCLFQRNNEKIHHRFHFIKRRRSLPLLYRKKAKRSTTLSPHRYAFSSSSILLPKLRPVVKTIVNDDSISYQKQTMIELSNESIDSMNNPIKSHHNHHYQNSQYPAQQQQQKYSQSLPGLYMLPIENVTATVGRQAILKCVTNHNGPSKPAWLKMDENSTPTLLTLGTNTLMNEDEGKYRVTQNENHWYLHINRVQVNDRGLYMCQINAKTMLSQIGYLDVFEPPVINEELTSSDTTVDELSKVSLRCATLGYPTPSITWRREDGKSLNLGQYGGKKIAEPNWQGEYLNITQVKRDDMGAYLCIANNGVQPAVSKRIVLQVNFPPKIRVHKQLIGSYLGSDVIIGCDVDASPRPELYWINGDGNRLDKMMENFDDDLSSTTIEHQSSTNNHHYNVFDSSFNDNNHQINNKKKYHFEQEQNGYRTTMKLIIRNLQLADYGSYKCSGHNSIGKKEGLIRLYETPPPIPPTPKTTTTTTTTTTSTTRPTTTTTTIRPFRINRKQKQKSKWTISKDPNNQYGFPNETPNVSSSFDNDYDDDEDIIDGDNDDDDQLSYSTIRKDRSYKKNRNQRRNNGGYPGSSKWTTIFSSLLSIPIFVLLL